jgi:hypothetical protein
MTVSDLPREGMIMLPPWLFYLTRKYGKEKSIFLPKVLNPFALFNKQHWCTFH